MAKLVNRANDVIVLPGGPVWCGISPSVHTTALEERKAHDATFCLSRAPLVAKLVGASPFSIVFNLRACEVREALMCEAQGHS